MMTHVAVVHAPDGIRLVVAASSRPAVYRELAAYVLRNAEHRLWPRDLIEIVDRVREGKLEDAVECYFAHVGSRWDAEWLECSETDEDRRPAEASGCSALIPTT